MTATLLHKPDDALYTALVNAYFEQSFQLREKFFAPERLNQIQADMPETNWLAPVDHLTLNAATNAIFSVLAAITPPEHHPAMIEKLKPLAQPSDP
jgi:hypothetical protein